MFNLSIRDINQDKIIGELLMQNDLIPREGDNVIVSGNKYVVQRRTYDIENESISIDVEKHIENTIIG